MSRPQRRGGAFSNNGIAELNDLLPPLPTPTPKPAVDTPADPSTPVPGESADAEPKPAPDAHRPSRENVRPLQRIDPLSEPDPKFEAEPAPTATVHTTPNGVPSPATRLRPPEASIAPDVYRALRDLALAERTADPTNARTYGQIVLDAVEDNVAVLAKHWRTARKAKSSALFQRSVTTRRRRNIEAPARVALAGIIASDAEQLDQLAVEWGAGSRSALTEHALRLYLKVSAPQD